MNKQEVITALSGMKCEIAEVKVDISYAGKVKFPNESILVRLVENPSNEDEIDNAEHWDLFDNIKDFENGTYYKQGANETYRTQYISNFISVTEFKGDYQKLRIAV